MQMATFMKANDATTKLKEKEFTYTTTGLSTKATEKMINSMEKGWKYDKTEQNTKETTKETTKTGINMALENLNGLTEVFIKVN